MTDTIGAIPAQDLELIERVGRAILQEVVHYSPDAVERYGRAALEAAGYQSLISERDKLDAECERAWESQKIAHEQAMANGSALAETRAALRDLVGAVERRWPDSDFTKSVHFAEPMNVARAALNRVVAHPNNEG